LGGAGLAAAGVAGVAAAGFAGAVVAADAGAGAGTAFAGAAGFALGFSAGASLAASRSRRTTGASIVDDADLTNSPMSFSREMSCLLSIPSSRASS
jgi:hypothetical protein